MTFDWLDIVTTILGLVYIYLEYKASIWLWIMGIVIPAMDVFLYWRHGSYGDADMTVYYTLATIYDYIAWKWGSKLFNQKKQELPITRMPGKRYLPTFLFFALAWGAAYYVLVRFTNSNVPLLDSFTNTLSFVGLWALTRKYVEQWLFWIAVDMVCTALYVYKGIPFKAGLYGLYVVIAVLGYFKWKSMMKQAAS